MNWITIGKWLSILAAAITQIAIPLCNGDGLSAAGIAAVLAAIVAAGVIHSGQVADAKLLARHHINLKALRNIR
jgi:hypothetical protein